MSSTKQYKKQTKQEKKARKEAAREATKRAEKRRNRVTIAVIVAIVLTGGTITAVTIIEDRRETAAAEAEREERLAELEAEVAAIEERSVACDADEPDNVGDEKPTFEDGPDQVIEEGVNYTAIIETSCGEVVLDLHADAAPETVNAFVFLAQEGFYDGLEVFRINEDIEVLQTGAGTNEASWNIGYTLPDELDLADEEGYPAGTVAMASMGPDSAGSQFFFVYGEGFEEVFGEEPTYTRFADVVSGLDVIEDIADRGALGELIANEVPSELVYMESVRIETD